MRFDEECSLEEMSEMVGLKGSRTRELLSGLVAKGYLTCTAATKNRRYVSVK